jgi:glycogen debranching enzyme
LLTAGILLIILLFSTLQINNTTAQIHKVTENTRLRLRDAVVNGMPYVYGYNNVWARDTLFSCLGFIADGQYEIVRKLLIYLWNTRYTSDIGDSISVIANTTTVRVGEDECIDSTPLWIIIANEYLQVSDDIDFREFIEKERCYEKLSLWLDTRMENGLVNQRDSDHYYSDWCDSARKGLRPKNVMYSNILFWKAYTILDVQKAFRLKENIEKEFWNGRYYRDFIGSEYLAADGNLLAIVWDFADREQSESILKNMNDMIFPLPTLTVKPRYIHDIGNYQNGRVWGWLGALSIVAYLKIHDAQNANRVKNCLVNILENENWRFSELYTENGSKDGAPFFIWFSGMFMYALHQFQEINSDNFIVKETILLSSSYTFSSIPNFGKRE